MPKRRSVGFPSQPESSAKLRSQDGLTSVCDIARSPGREKLDSTAEMGYLHCGPKGAGHFVKMVHNGIEYGLLLE